MTTLFKVKTGLAVLSFIALAGFASSLPAAAQSDDNLDRHVIITNGMRNDYLLKLYGSNIRERNWKYEFLQGVLLAPGGSVNVNVDDNDGWCRFDLMAEFASGKVLIMHDVNICELERWTIHA